jgi:hypothetical protein
MGRLLPDGVDEYVNEISAIEAPLLAANDACGFKLSVVVSNRPNGAIGVIGEPVLSYV